MAEPVVTSHDNPQATLDTSLKIYAQYTLAKLYSGHSVFWALNPQPDDYITVKFETPQIIKRLVTQPVKCAVTSHHFVAYHLRHPLF